MAGRSVSLKIERRKLKTTPVQVVPASQRGSPSSPPASALSASWRGGLRRELQAATASSSALVASDTTKHLNRAERKRAKSERWSKGARAAEARSAAWSGEDRIGSVTADIANARARGKSGWKRAAAFGNANGRTGGRGAPYAIGIVATAATREAVKKVRPKPAKEPEARELKKRAWRTQMDAANALMVVQRGLGDSVAGRDSATVRAEYKEKLDEEARQLEVYEAEKAEAARIRERALAASRDWNGTGGDRPALPMPGLLKGVRDLQEDRLEKAAAEARVAKVEAERKAYLAEVARKKKQIEKELRKLQKREAKAARRKQGGCAAAACVIS